MSWPALGQATTPGAIRDRMLAVVEALVPVQLNTPFKRYRNEGAGNFLKWAESEPASAFRRFQVRDAGIDNAPQISNTDFEEQMATFTVIVAYPQTARAGQTQALARDDIMERDWVQINAAIGMAGRPNFSPPNPDAVWDARSANRLARVVGTACDFMQARYVMRYRRSQTP